MTTYTYRHKSTGYRCAIVASETVRGYWYAKRYAHTMPLHGKIGTVKIANRRGKPRNHGIEIDGVLWVVPCGNLRVPPLPQEPQP